MKISEEAANISPHLEQYSPILRVEPKKMEVLGIIGSPSMYDKARDFKPVYKVQAIGLL